MSNSLDYEYEQLRIIYSEIINGYCFSEDKGIYVKHLTELEHGELARKKASLFLKFKKEGLLSEEEKLKQLIKAEMWSDEKEEEILSLRYFISDNEKNLAKIIPQQHAPILKAIDDAKKKLSELLITRRDTIGVTANEYSERDSVLYLIHLSLYKDKELNQKFFSQPDDMDDLEDDEISEYANLVDSVFKRYDESTVKKVAVMPFFINYYINAKSAPNTFLGKPLAHFTSTQLFLISLGNRNLNILEQAHGEPPELMGDTKIMDVVNWYDQQYSIILGRRKAEK